MEIRRLLKERNAGSVLLPGRELPKGCENGGQRSGLPRLPPNGLLAELT